MNGIPLEIAGKTYTLRYDINALSDAELLAGKSISALTQEKSINGLRVLFWAGLKHGDPNLSVSKAGAILQSALHSGMDIGQVGDAIASALKQSGLVPKGESENEDESGGSPGNE